MLWGCILFVDEGITQSEVSKIAQPPLVCCSPWCCVRDVVNVVMWDTSLLEFGVVINESTIKSDQLNPWAWNQNGFTHENP